MIEIKLTHKRRLVKDETYKLWSFQREGMPVRYLDQYESEFVTAAYESGKAAAINEQLLEALKNLIAGYEDTNHTGLMDMQVCGSDVMAACAAIAAAEAQIKEQSK